MTNGESSTSSPSEQEVADSGSASTTERSDGSSGTSAGPNRMMALVLNVLLPPMGHLYVGELRRGVYLWLGAFGLVAVSMVVLLARPDLFGITFAGLAMLVRGLWLPIDSLLLARPARWRQRSRPVIRRRTYALAVVLIVVASATGTGLISTWIQAFRMPSEGMSPALVVGDFFFVDKTPQARSTLRRGDIVVFPFPQQPDKEFTKRIVGLPNEVIVIRDKQVFVNGLALKEPYAFHTATTIRPAGDDNRDNFGPWRIPPGELFVMGDNRDNSNDSRYWGTLLVHTVRGRASVVYWSWDAPRSRVRWERIGMSLR